MKAIVDALPPVTLPSFQIFTATRQKDESSATCFNPQCSLNKRAQFTHGRTACRLCKTPFKKELLCAEEKSTAPSSLFEAGSMPSAEKKEFGIRVRQLREERGLSQKQMAEKIGCAHTYLTKVEHGRTVPGIDQHVKLANALGMTLSEFVDKTWGAIIYPPTLSPLER